jgi:hypothetical protein
MIIVFILQCIKAYRVIKDSMKPAMIKKGIKPITIFKPLIAPILKEVNREYVPGNKILFPMTKPAAAAITIEESSMVPCSRITGRAWDN